MIRDVDDTIEKLLQLEFGTPLPFDLSFAIPDNNFGPVSNAKNTLNCYLYDIREDRDLRQIEPRLHRTADGFIEKEYPAARIKLSYCITAWSPARVMVGTAPALDEHRLLSQVLRLLLRYPVLPVVALLGSLVDQEPPLPTTAVLPDSIKNSSEFWSAIGGQLRPSLEYSVTISLDYQKNIIGPIVHSLHVDIKDGESFYTLGGAVYDSNVPPKGVTGAWVRVTETGQTYVTGIDGRFRIERIAAGSYTLVVRAVGFQESGRIIQVPLSNGDYDIKLAP